MPDPIFPEKLELQLKSPAQGSTLGRQSQCSEGVLWSFHSPGPTPTEPKGFLSMLPSPVSGGGGGIWQHAQPHDDIFISAKKNALSDPHQPKTRSYQDFAIGT